MSEIKINETTNNVCPGGGRVARGEGGYDTGTGTVGWGEREGKRAKSLRVRRERRARHRSAVVVAAVPYHRRGVSGKSQVVDGVVSVVTRAF